MQRYGGKEMMEFFRFLNDQLLKMNWLDDLISLLVENVFGLSAKGRIGGSIHFFLYDTIKIFILLSVLIFLSSLIQSFFPPERTRRILSRVKGLPGNILGALLGTVTPFCSCSSIPIFIGFTSAGLPIGVTFSFLISSPLVDLASILLLASVFNWRIALAYVVVGLILSVIGGSTIGALKLESQIESFVFQPSGSQPEEGNLSCNERLRFAFDQVVFIVKKVWLYILIGVLIGSVIHNIIPEEWVAMILGKENAFSVLIATVLGVPMYADIFGTLPIAEALVGKGVGIGTVLSFMMAVTALSLPSLIMLKKVVRTRLLAVFFGIIVIGLILIGYLFNAFSFLLI